jgi:hypothetical protein
VGSRVALFCAEPFRRVPLLARVVDYDAIGVGMVLGAPTWFRRCRTTRRHVETANQPWLPKPSFPAIIPEGSHPFPSRTRKLSPSGPMVLQGSTLWESRSSPGLFLCTNKCLGRTQDNLILIPRGGYSNALGRYESFTYLTRGLASSNVREPFSFGSVRARGVLVFRARASRNEAPQHR